MRLSGNNTVEQPFNRGSELPPATHQYNGTTWLHNSEDCEVEQAFLPHHPVARDTAKKLDANFTRSLAMLQTVFHRKHHAPRRFQAQKPSMQNGVVSANSSQGTAQRQFLKSVLLIYSSRHCPPFYKSALSTVHYRRYLLSSRYLLTPIMACIQQYVCDRCIANISNGFIY